MPTVDVSSTSDTDDGIRAATSPNFSTTEDPSVGFNTSGPTDIQGWFAFPSVGVPAGATIDVAYITLVANSGGVGTTITSKIYGVDEDSHATPTTDGEWSTDHGIHTTAAVDWDFTRQTSGSMQTPSIVSVIQELVDRGGWASGNNIGIHIDNDGVTGNHIQRWDENTTANRAVLHIEYTLFSSTNLYATGTQTIVDVVNESDNTTSLHISVDDDPDSPSDTDWVNNTSLTASVFFDLTDMPSTFDAAQQLELVVRYRGQNWSGASLTLYAQVFQSDESTALSDEEVVATVSTDGSFANTSTVTFSGLVGSSKAVWDGARVRFRWG